MSVFQRVRPSARGAAAAVFRRSVRGRLSLLVALAGVGLPLAALAATPTPPRPAASHLPAGPGVLTLYSEPGLKGRHATYRTASRQVERQGFIARSAASTGMWTLCEGAEVASRCQTVDGRASELKLAPQIVRPGLNALALYDQPGLRGRQVIYSFPADRPAPFHARSARTWGGPWSLCDRDFSNCRTIDGRSQGLDLVVASVRPEAAAAGEPPASIPIARVRGAPPHPPRLLRVSARYGRSGPRRTAAPARQHLAHAKPVLQKLRDHRVPNRRAARRPMLIEVREHPRAHHAPAARPDAIRLVGPRFHARPVAHSHLLKVSERRARHSHAARRRIYRRVRVVWSGDPYLYDVDPRAWGPPPAW